MRKIKIDCVIKKCKTVLLITFVVVIFINGCDYLFRGEYPNTYASTVWVSNEPDWVMTVDSENVMTSIIIIDGKQLNLEIHFRGHCMDVWNMSERLFRGHGIFDSNKFIIDYIIEDKLFDFEYEEITFIRLGK